MRSDAGWPGRLFSRGFVLPGDTKAAGRYQEGLALPDTPRALSKRCRIAGQEKWTASHARKHLPLEHGFNYPWEWVPSAFDLDNFPHAPGLRAG